MSPQKTMRKAVARKTTAKKTSAMQVNGRTTVGRARNGRTAEASKNGAAPAANGRPGAANRVWGAVKRHPVRAIGALAIGVGAAAYITRRARASK